MKSSETGRKNGGGKIQIFTLGRFMVVRNGLVLSREASRSKKLWDLFKFLLAYRNKLTPVDESLELLWPDQEYADPGVAMRSLIFRLRHFLSENIQAPELSDNIAYAQGCYSWENNNNYWLDVDSFEEICQKAEKMDLSNVEEVINTYQEAISLYKGVFLPESIYCEWSIPIRNYYHRLFIKCVINITDLMKKEKRSTEIIQVCENAIMIEYFEEDFHLKLIEALLHEGKDKKAISHYEEVTAVFYREMGVKPSTAMRNLYRMASVRIKGNFELDLTYVQEALKDRQNTKGPLVCDLETFKYFYKLEIQRMERSGGSVFLGMITITKDNFSKVEDKLLNVSMDILLDALTNNLRKSDVAAKWSDAQFLVILPGLKASQAVIVLKRIESSCKAEFASKGLMMHLKQQELLPSQI